MPTQPAAESPRSQPGSKPAQVLVIDDSLVCRKALLRILKTDGCHVLEASSGDEALAALADARPDIILCDVQMPGMSGFDVCQALKANEEWAEIPVLFVTAEHETANKVRGFELGAADYITKGAKDAEILARVRTHIRLAALQADLRTSRDALRDQLREIRAHTKRQQELNEQIQTQQMQLMQNEKMASVGQLAAGMAHELNNPIGFIASNLNALGDYAEDIKRVLGAATALSTAALEGGADVAEQAKTLNALFEEVDLTYLLDDLGNLIHESVDGAERVRKIVADLRDFSHVDSQEHTMASVNDLIDKTLSVAASKIPSTVEVVREFGTVPEVPCFGGKLNQVFLNILVNALQAIENTGRITIRTGATADGVWVEVIDTGCGIAEEHRPRIFDPFFTTRPVGSGTGLGLHLSTKIVDSHGGRISVESEVGAGSTFRVELPLRHDDAQSQPAPDSDLATVR